MKKFGLKPITWRTFVRTTDSRHALPVYPNLIKNRQVRAVNQVWVADITYIRIQSSFVYLAAILDLYSRRIVGWAISKRIDTELCVAALRLALETRRSRGCVHHSDRGVQYASSAYVALLRQHGLQISMSAKGNPYDNAFIESFYKTLKYEEVVCCECARGNGGCNASSKMRVGPSESACRSRFQTAASCAGQEPDVVNVAGKGGEELRQVRVEETNVHEPSKRCRNVSRRCRNRDPHFCPANQVGGFLCTGQPASGIEAA